MDFANSHMTVFLLGMIIVIPVWIVWLRKAHFLQTWEHEFTHMLFNIVFFHKPRKFFVSDYEGGYVEAEYGYNFVEYLAPYFFPTFAYLFLPLSLIIKDQYYFVYTGILGFFTAYHFISNTRELLHAWYLDNSDLAIAGKFFSIIFIVFAGIISYGLIFTFISNGFAGSWTFLHRGMLHSVRLLTSCL
ncbi:MAG: hypothetical protein ABIL66_08895 [candidate division WOR-3 bacterium]